MEIIEIKEILTKASVEVDIQGHGKHTAIFKSDFEKIAMILFEKLNVPFIHHSFIEDKWKEYRQTTNNEDAWSFKEWLKHNYS